MRKIIIFRNITLKRLLVKLQPSVLTNKKPTDNTVT